MKRIPYEEYLDKTYGCWIGKCVAGTIGGPHEGAKELFDFKFTREMIEKMLPNDDLDLQVLWLSVLEEKGIAFTEDDLADAFLNRCPYAPGEYAFFKKNYARGIHPPESGRYNNRYYINGMGCPIRSEIWACISPGNPGMAAYLASKDGVLDHAGDSVFAEQFLAAIEAAAFLDNNLEKLVDIGLGVIPGNSKTAAVIRHVRDWCRESDDWRYVRSRVLREYGHPDCTNMYQNIGITLLALLLGKKDFIETTMIAVNCGFDTDCTCATAGAILGIIHGAEKLMQDYDLGEQKFSLSVDAPRRSDSVRDLAEDTCFMGLYFARHLNRKAYIFEGPPTPQITLPAKPSVKISVDYQGDPAIGIGDTRKIRMVLENCTEKPLHGELAIESPEGWQVDNVRKAVALPAGRIFYRDVNIHVPADIPVLNETNLFDVRFVPRDGEITAYRFGFVGALVWKVFGPFWRNNVELPPLKEGESYHKYVSGSTKDEYADNVRTYHLNTRVDLDREYMTLDEIVDSTQPVGSVKEARIVNFYEDLISMGDAVGFQGPCSIYMTRRLISPEDREVAVLVGHTDAYRLWINGEMISRSDDVDWWTGENQHIHGVSLSKGENVVIVQLFRRSQDAKFSLFFTKGGACTEHFTDFASANPNVTR